MIKLTDFTIAYDNRIIIDHADFEARLGEITIITGESGCGKTSVLNVVSLNGNSDIKSYTINGISVDINNQDMIRDIQNQYFAYVIQDYELFTSLSIKDNIEMIKCLTEKPVDEKEVLALVQLDHMPLKQKVYMMSGGEKQRLALALAIIRNTDYILLDEPTASLDITNATIISNVLNKLKEEGKGIIAVTHNKDLIDADCIYKVENQKLIKEKDTINEEVKLDSLKKYVPKRLPKHFYKSRKNYYRLFVMIVGICLGLTGIIYSKGKAKIQNLEALINSSTDDSILIYDSELNSDGVGTFLQNYSVTKEVLDYKGISSSYPYYRFTDSSFSFDNTDQIDEVFEVYQDDQIVKPLYNYITDGESFWSESEDNPFIGNVISCDKNNMGCLLENKDIDVGLYMPKHLYERYGLESIDNLKIRMTINIPVLVIENFQEDQVGNKYLVRSPYTTRKVIEMPVKGIIYTDMAQYYKLGSRPLNVYLDYREFEKIHRETFEAYYDQAIKVALENKNKILDDQGLNEGYIVKLKDTNDYENLKKYLETINPNYTTASEGMNYIQELKLVKEQNKIQNALSFILVIIIIFTTMIVQKLDFNKQILGLSYLKINGANIEDLQRNIIFKLMLRSLIIGFLIVFSYLSVQAIIYETSTTYNAILNMPAMIVIVCAIIALYLSNYMINIKAIKNLSIQLLSKKS